MLCCASGSVQILILNLDCKFSSIVTKGENIIKNLLFSRTKLLRFYQQLFTMGRFQRGVHFGADFLKRADKSSKFPIANFF